MNRSLFAFAILSFLAITPLRPAFAISDELAAEYEKDYGINEDSKADDEARQAKMVNQQQRMEASMEKQEDQMLKDEAARIRKEFARDPEVADLLTANAIEKMYFNKKAGRSIVTQTSLEVALELIRENLRNLRDYRQGLAEDLKEMRSTGKLSASAEATIRGRIKEVDKQITESRGFLKTGTEKLRDPNLQRTENEMALRRIAGQEKKLKEAVKRYRSLAENQARSCSGANGRSISSAKPAVNLPDPITNPEFYGCGGSEFCGSENANQ